MDEPSWFGLYYGAVKKYQILTSIIRLNWGRDDNSGERFTLLTRARHIGPPAVRHLHRTSIAGDVPF
jgi:hypothetical protein